MTPTTYQDPHAQARGATTPFGAPDAHFKTNPQAYAITKQNVTPDSVIPVTMAPGGGFGISFRKL